MELSPKILGLWLVALNVPRVEPNDHAKFHRNRLSGIGVNENQITNNNTLFYIFISYVVSQFIIMIFFFSKIMQY